MHDAKKQIQKYWMHASFAMHPLETEKVLATGYKEE